MALGGALRLNSEITDGEIRLAVRDIPRNKAGELDLSLAKEYIDCPLAHRYLASLLTSMMKRNYITKKQRRFFVVPLDRPGEDPARCGKERPAALLRPWGKLLELVFVRRLTPYVEQAVSGSQYANQRLRGAGILLPDLDRLATNEKKKK